MLQGVCESLLEQGGSASLTTWVFLYLGSQKQPLTSMQANPYTNHLCVNREVSVAAYSAGVLLLGQSGGDSGRSRLLAAGRDLTLPPLGTATGASAAAQGLRETISELDMAVPGASKSSRLSVRCCYHNPPPTLTRPVPRSSWCWSWLVISDLHRCACPCILHACIHPLCSTALTRWSPGF